MLTPFGRRIKARLKELRLLQNDLAEAVGLEAPQISRILYGESRTGVETIIRMAEFLHEDADEYVRLFAGRPIKDRDDNWMIDKIERMFSNWGEEDRQLFLDFAEFLDRKHATKETAKDEGSVG